MDGLRPGEVEIRRALAECMTVADIDDAMGWPPGTARRRRWRALERGGLPAADAELGGVAIWFRSTIEHWLTDRQRPRRPRSGAAPDSAHEPVMSAVEDDSEETAAPSAVAQEPVEAGDGMQQAELSGEPLPDSEPEPAVEEPDVAGGMSSVVGDEVADDEPDRDHAGDGEADGHEVAEVPDVGEPGDVEPGDVEPGDVESVGERDETVGTGFELESGQWVLAEVHGRWREAQVVHRDRATVVVNYSLDGTPLGARRQRIDVHRVRLRPAQG